jgi:hypothetical protein
MLPLVKITETDEKTIKEILIDEFPATLYS